jgi:hypothetical protein
MVESMENKEVAMLFYSTFIVQGRRLFTEFLEERQRVGELREELDVEMAAALFLVSLTGSLWMIELYGGKYVENLEDERVLGQVCDIFLHGVKRR